MRRGTAIYANYGPFSLLRCCSRGWCSSTAGSPSPTARSRTTGPRQALRLSGSSLFTLGFDAPHAAPRRSWCSSRPRSGCCSSRSLISYLPAIYGAFSQARGHGEQAAGARGAAGVGRARRRHRCSPGRSASRVPASSPISGSTWSRGSSTSRRPTPRSRCSSSSARPTRASRGSPRPARFSTPRRCSTPRSTSPAVPEAKLCLRAGFLALQSIADFYRVDFDRDPPPGDPISIRREE